MYKIGTLFLIALFLFGCNVTSVPNKNEITHFESTLGKDNYWFEKIDFHKDNVTVKLVTYKSVSELRASVKKYNIVSTNLIAFTLRKQSEDKCEIHLVDPRIQYMPEFAGHELYHCFYGSWHK